MGEVAALVLSISELVCPPELPLQTRRGHDGRPGLTPKTGRSPGRRALPLPTISKAPGGSWVSGTPPGGSGVCGGEQ